MSKYNNQNRHYHMVEVDYNEETGVLDIYQVTEEGVVQLGLFYVSEED